ncbi:cellulose binding domain-containing protein [Streptomyces sp. NY05-11A]|uniref:cellulose binding domain-containing protein n=1 Tax=Streptomyces soliscabiei TaxID=588897 RepID=UPI0029B401DE|nr:cellulose binding domain-containing protein [Streptomyces sp. NY05-11A]MDX2675090.1 cellulose binding domain-containing protein [Streptomyces sp. NY05-11A]
MFGCSVSHRVTYRWNGGFHADVTITDTGNVPISGWTLRWSFIRGQMMTNTWNATSRQSGAEVSATDVPKPGTTGSTTPTPPPSP